MAAERTLQLEKPSVRLPCLTFKFFLAQLSTLYAHMPLEARLKTILSHHAVHRVITLERRDVVAMFMSLRWAWVYGIWGESPKGLYAKAEHLKPLSLSIDWLRNAIAEYRRFFETTRRLAHALYIPLLSVYSEDLSRNDTAEIDRIVEWLGFPVAHTVETTTPKPTHNATHTSFEVSADKPDEGNYHLNATFARELFFRRCSNAAAVLDAMRDTEWAKEFPFYYAGEEVNPN